MGNEDLGRHFESIGMLQEASEAYARMRQDVSTTKHIIDCGMHLADVALQRRDWTMVLNNVGKIGGVQNSEEEKATQAYTKIVSGISLLGMGHYGDAAQSFLQTDANVSPAEYAGIASPNDVAVYGGLTALATMNRQDLQQRVLENHNFRVFLEHEPHIRKAISLFINGRYSNCLSILESARPDYLLDIHLQKHVPAIYSSIRTKCIVQYFVPFSCVTISCLEAAFAKSGQSIERELAHMIREGSLKARIDGKDKVRASIVHWHPSRGVTLTVMGFAATSGSSSRSASRDAKGGSRGGAQVRARGQGAATAHQPRRGRPGGRGAQEASRRPCRRAEHRRVVVRGEQKSCSGGWWPRREPGLTLTRSSWS